MWTLAVMCKGVDSVCLPLTGCWMFAGSRLQRTVRRAWRRQNESTTWIRCVAVGDLNFASEGAKGNTNNREPLRIP